MMSLHGQLPSPGADDWIEQVRDFLHHQPPPGDDSILEAAYEASEVDTATMFAYFEGRLTAEERQDVEAEAASSPHALRKLARVGAIVARSRGGVSSIAAQKAAAPTTETVADSSPATRRVVHRVKLAPPRLAGLDRLPRTEDMTRIAGDPNYELYRSLERNRDQLRIYHQAAPIGTLLAVRFLKSQADEEASPWRFVVLRRGTESSTTTTLFVPAEFQQAEVDVELAEMPPSDLGAEEAGLLLKSYENAGTEDPVSTTPLHAPRSAWQTWADGVLSRPADQIHPAIRDAAELIAAS